MKIIHEAPSVNHLVRRKLIFNDKKEKIKEHGKRRRNSCFTECCACCSLCCCLISSLILILLLVAGIITLLVLLLTNRSTTNPDTTGMYSLSKSFIKYSECILSIYSIHYNNRYYNTN